RKTAGISECVQHFHPRQRKGRDIDALTRPRPPPGRKSPIGVQRSAPLPGRGWAELRPASNQESGGDVTGQKPPPILPLIEEQPDRLGRRGSGRALVLPKPERESHAVFQDAKLRRGRFSQDRLRRRSGGSAFS